MEGKGLACWVLYDQNSPVYLLPMNKHDNITLKCCFWKKKSLSKPFPKLGILICISIGLWGKNSKARQNTGQILRKKHFCASRNVIPCRFNDVQVPKWRIFAFCLWWWWFFFLRFHLSGHSITRWTWRGGGRSVTVGHMIKSTI